jgi:hypothetical protein
MKPSGPVPGNRDFFPDHLTAVAGADFAVAFDALDSTVGDRRPMR